MLDFKQFISTMTAQQVQGGPVCCYDAICHEALFLFLLVSASGERPMKTTKPLFFSRQLGDYVTDAMCECGHLQSEHGSLVMRVGLRNLIRSGHDGDCCEGACDCSKFTWVRWVTIEEAADKFVAKKANAA